MKYLIVFLLLFTACNTGIKQEDLIQGVDSTFIDSSLKVIPDLPHYDAAISRALKRELIAFKIDSASGGVFALAGTQRYGTYLTTQTVTQDKINSFRGFLRGIRLRFGTIDINTGNNIYNYSVIDNAVSSAQSNTLSVLFQMWRNPLIQDPVFWKLPPYNIPIVLTNDSRPDLKQYYYYLDTNYIFLCDKATTALSLHLKAYTNDQQKTIVGWLGSFGVTGDRGDYKGTPFDSKYIIPPQTFNDYWHTSTQKLIDANKINKWLNIAGNPNNDATDWDYLINLGITELKVGELGHSEGASGQQTIFKRLLTALSVNPAYIFFSESEGVQQDTSWRAQDFFPLVVSFVSAGGKILSIAATDNVTDTSLAFLNQYAGSATGGYSYMRDEIDYADSIRFTPASYGAVIDPARLNQYKAQVQKVNNDKTSGAAAKAEKLSALLENYISPIRQTKIQDEYIPKGYSFNINSVHLNDGGTDVWPGNYEMRLHQKVFEGYGVNRIGDENLTFGKRAKAIQYAAWDYDDSIISEIKLTYFDNRASWSVRTANGPGATLLKVINGTNTKRWVQLVLPVTNFKKRGINGNDVVISSERGKCVLQIIEVK